MKKNQIRDRQPLANWNTGTPDTAKTYWANGLPKSIDNGVSKSDSTYNNRNELISETQTLVSRPARVAAYTEVETLGRLLSLEIPVHHQVPPRAARALNTGAGT